MIERLSSLAFATAVILQVSSAVIFFGSIALIVLTSLSVIPGPY